jgi:outer membrane protein TolC
MAVVTGALACVILAPALIAQQPLTLDEALREAHSANASLPVAALGVDIARSEVRELQAGRWPSLSVEGGIFAGGPPAYTTSQGQLQLAGVDSVYTGGRRRANLNAARYHVDAAGAGYRMAEKDVDLAVRLRFIEVLRADEEITIRQQGIARLRTYLTEVQNRKAAGQPVGSDVLTTQVRLGTEEAVLADAEQTRDEARLQLNDLLGRDPDGPLVLEPLPAPAPPTAPGGEPWLNAPEVRAAAANRGAAESGIAATRAERRPQLALSANLGVLPVFADSDAGTGINSGSGFGGMVMLSMSWPFWDGGAWRARLDRAQILATQARDSEAVVRRQSRLAWELANAQLTRLYQQVQSWAHNVPLARDAYLQTESIYNGGAATALEVLDAYAAWITVNDSYADAVLRYRQAEASYLRWGTP